MSSDSISTEENILNRLRDCVASLDSQGVKKAIKEALDIGIAPAKIIANGVSKGSQTVGRKFESGEYFLSELIIAGEITKEALQFLRPHIEKLSITPVGTIVIGTVEGDIHDIGKSIMIMFLQSYGFEVIDLGVDVSGEDFVRAVEEHRPQVLAMSALMTHTATVMGDVIKRLEERGLRNKVKIIIGGTPTSPEFGKVIHADYQTTDPLEGVEKCLEWTRTGDDSN